MPPQEENVEKYLSDISALVGAGADLMKTIQQTCKPGRERTEVCRKIAAIVRAAKLLRAGEALNEKPWESDES